MKKLSLFDFTLTSLEGKSLPLSAYKGKVLFISNIATQCGFTSQLKELEALYQHFKKDIIVIGIPTNNFGGQTPEEGMAIESFCQKNYGVSFLLTEKMEAKGKDQHPFFVFLSDQKKGTLKWNFEKFLFDKNGQFIDYYLSLTSPLKKSLIKKIEEIHAL